jgi:hypothetical protein
MDVFVKPPSYLFADSGAATLASTVSCVPWTEWFLRALYLRRYEEPSEGLKTRFGTVSHISLHFAGALWHQEAGNIFVLDVTLTLFLRSVR